jgi:hypothetical protein
MTQEDPVRYWQDLTANYRQMSDGELLQLSEKPEELTEVARQVLGDEMKLRKLSAVEAQPLSPVSVPGNAPVNWEPRSYRNEFVDREAEEAAGPREYTWKTKLCDCETRIEAVQLAAALQRAGIESWIQDSSVGSGAFDLTYPRVFVAADQLEEAHAVAAQPIPQDIIAESLEVEDARPLEFELPRCPKCGAHDPVLCAHGEQKIRDPKSSGEDWVNHWVCEACGAEWSDPQAAPEEEGDGRRSSSF